MGKGLTNSCAECGRDLAGKDYYHGTNGKNYCAEPDARMGECFTETAIRELRQNGRMLTFYYVPAPQIKG